MYETMQLTLLLAQNSRVMRSNQLAIITLSFVVQLTGLPPVS